MLNFWRDVYKGLLDQTGSQPKVITQGVEKKRLSNKRAKTCILLNFFNVRLDVLGTYGAVQPQNMARKMSLLDYINQQRLRPLQSDQF